MSKIANLGILYQTSVSLSSVAPLAEANHLIEIRLAVDLGSVEYSGTPTVKKSISGLGSVASLVQLGGNPSVVICSKGIVRSPSGAPFFAVS
jgi:hypothetical protein